MFNIWILLLSNSCLNFVGKKVCDVRLKIPGNVSDGLFRVLSEL